jgi:DNA ligase (NAD+)
VNSVWWLWKYTGPRPAWIERLRKLAPDAEPEFFCDIKMDGLACALIYQDGKFVQAITRGDGFVGEDVTHNVRTIDNVPFDLRRSRKYGSFLEGRTEIRGEIIMHKKDFEQLNKQREKEGLPLFANPRNLAAGTIRQLDPKLAEAAGSLTFSDRAEAVILIEASFIGIATYSCTSFAAGW